MGTKVMTSAFARVEEYFVAFQEQLGTVKTHTPFSPSALMDTVNRLARLKDRYDAERPKLSPVELGALDKVFRSDPYIAGVLESRQIGEHVTKRGGATIRTTRNEPIELDCETSAMGFFAAREVRVVDVEGRAHNIDHVRQLEEAERRIAAALRRAKNIPAS